MTAQGSSTSEQPDLVLPVPDASEVAEAVAAMHEQLARAGIDLPGATSQEVVQAWRRRFMYGSAG